ncbi:MAG: 2-amino-4-hydroxy-6-hydroxymethyldihydropteridine pyrophosphokinase FolK [Thermacetogenium phaeum]|uniref:2-amino-4-hydroxy-6-hydroxymethyldihydropteridine diphosphokinase n=1 Tax=Thermacetogenium phaeum TaxID=85874 RepID=A0A101FGK6_9THEO|nr:MAG: 2-amino-4-hydroxy-6-hydroxymethyldihydropteridine pyrophosphokinase FolK [Thermacetogenium phaeum]
MSEHLPFRAFVGLGSNLGDRSGYLSLARQELEKHPLIAIKKASSIYESEPVGYLEQDWFLNQVLEIATGLQPFELLAVMQEIENCLGRERKIRWGPRVIDLDLLLFEDLVVSTPELTIPHPRMYERSFVLIPLCEIAPDFLHPDGVVTREHLQRHLEKRGGERIRLYQG